MTHLCAVVCVNGLGHFKRVMEVVDLLHRGPDGSSIQTDVYAEAWQVAKLRDWRPLAHLADTPSIRFHQHGMSGSPRWDASTWIGDDYFSWVESLGKEAPLLRADMVLSDNLVGVLSVRPDALLMGSFLWHDVIRAVSEAAESVASFEEQLLVQNRPTMLCVADIVMPAVERLTRAVPLPWFCEEGNPLAERPWPLRRILLAGGATDVASSALRELALVIREHTELALAAPTQIAGNGITRSSRVSTFDFSDVEFAACGLAVGRPGAGLLTDCVRHGLPILCFGDEENSEIQHNARRVEELDFGRRISLNDPESTLRVLERLSDSEYVSWSRNASTRPRGGTASAARFIARRLSLAEDHG